MNTSPIWYFVGSFVGRLIGLFPMNWMCMIWLNTYLFYWRLVLIMYLSLRAVMTRTLLHFPVSFLLEMDYKTCWTVVGYFLPMPRIQKMVLFLDGNKWLHGLLFAYWLIYDILWCSKYCVKMPMGILLGRKLILTSNISSLIKG